MNTNNSKRRFAINTYQVLFLFLWLLSVSSSLWAAIGLPQNTARIGTAFNPSFMEVNDPDGGNPDKELMIPFTMIATDWLMYGNRYWIEYVNGRAVYTATENKVGQNLGYSALRFVVQRHLNLSKQIKPWFGAGLLISRSTYRTRHTKTSDDFLIQKFEDRIRNKLGLIINSTIDYRIEKKWSLGIKAEQTFTTKLDAESLGAGIFLLYLL